jgi:DNA-binding NtrC family response regulator
MKMSERLMIVDDEPDMLMLLEMIIHDNTEYAVETTNNPAECLELLQKRHFDLVITDLKMPGIDGMELFKELRELKPELPVIIITAYGLEDAADKAIKAGISDFITKPFKKERILFAIMKALEIKRLREKIIKLRKQLGDE